MSLPIGTTAPDFTLTTKTADGLAQINLSSEISKGPVLLLFFPMAFTGVCTTEFCDVTQGLSQYENLNARVFGISGDNPFAQEAWATKEGIKVPLLSDYEHTIARLYQVAYDSFLPEVGLPMGGVPKRSAFIIDQKGVIQYSESSDNPKELPDFAAILKKLEELSA